MRRSLQSIMTFLCVCISLSTAVAQTGQYSLRYNAGTQRYTVYGKLDADYAPPMSRFLNVFVTVMVPTGTGVNQFTPSSITTDAGLASSNVVSFTRINAPSYNSTKDYIFFNFDVGSANYVPNTITANTEFAIFSFASLNGCLPGSINAIVHGSSDYTSAQSNSINAGNAFEILGAGGETYTGNYGSATVACATTPPIISAAYTPNPMTAGQNGTLTLTATNSAGNPAQSGMGYAYTLPTGMSFPAGATVTNSCGGTATITGNTLTFTGGSMSSGSATCTISVPVVAASAGTINPSTATLTSLTGVTAAPNNGAGSTPVSITVSPAACAASAGVLSY